MVGVFIAIAVCAVFLVSFFVDQVPKHLLPEEVWYYFENIFL